MSERKEKPSLPVDTSPPLDRFPVTEIVGATSSVGGGGVKVRRKSLPFSVLSMCTLVAITLESKLTGVRGAEVDDEVVVSSNKAPIWKKRCAWTQKQGVLVSGIESRGRKREIE